MKKFLSLLLVSAVMVASFCGCGSKAGSNEVVVYNWGEYIDPDVIKMFEEETGIKVVYDEFETNEMKKQNYKLKYELLKENKDNKISIILNKILETIIKYKLYVIVLKLLSWYKYIPLSFLRLLKSILIPPLENAHII